MNVDYLWWDAKRKIMYKDVDSAPQSNFSCCQHANLGRNHSEFLRDHAKIHVIQENLWWWCVSPLKQRNMMKTTRTAHVPEWVCGRGTCTAGRDPVERSSNNVWRAFTKVTPCSTWSRHHKVLREAIGGALFLLVLIHPDTRSSLRCRFFSWCTHPARDRADGGNWLPRLCYLA